MALTYYILMLLSKYPHVDCDMERCLRCGDNNYLAVNVW